MLDDCYNRQLNYLRVSVTDRCNLCCNYCVPRETVPYLKHVDILRYEEILRIIRIGVSLGIDKIRITGGEPLVRHGLMAFLKKLMAVEGIKEVTLTTNAVLARPFLVELREIGIRRLNISLDTLRRGRYIAISGRDRFEQVWANILEAHHIGFAPLKINVVAMKGVNDDEFQALAALTYEWPFHIRFIEYMPMGNPRLMHDPFISNDEIRQQVERLGPLEAVARNSNYGPAERFRFSGAIGEIGFISSRSNHFCSDCNRLRLTASGKLRPCLLLDRELDIKQALRSGACDSELAEVFIRAARSKPSAHLLNNASGLPVNSMMTSIGG